ncbi:MAG TPA: class I SAM-dependent methyltransferase [Lacunisphaera sp.]|jgi:ubiquinone/menaquinone biosynthesis C-methylase UbiE
MSDKPHSADYFGDSRDFWWNRDFLELMARRWAFSDVKSVLDVGCGVGHWGRCLAPLLPSDCAMTGVDRERQWVDEAHKRSTALGERPVSFVQGAVERLPFADDSFDLVTCQTVLIHLKDPRVGLAEMIRVLRPGGLLVLAEPNNTLANFSNIALKKPVRELVDLIEFQMFCERGKMNLDEGFDSAGSLVAGWLAELNVERIESYLSDKTIMLFPPYASAHGQALIGDAREMSSRNFWRWDRKDTLRFFVAGGGKESAFERSWENALASEKEWLEGIDRQTLSMTYGSIIYLVSGRKKRTSSQQLKSNLV